MSAGRFRAGDEVVVRSHAEVLATLDAHGTLDGLPFMAEMVDSCGKPFRIQRRVEKTCVANHPIRRFAADDVVILDGPRCDGGGHDGCGHGCRMFWKEAWLRPGSAAAAPGGSSDSDVAKLRARLKSKADERRYFCQSTELLKATQPFPGKQRLWRLRILFREIARGDLSVLQVLMMAGNWAQTRFLRALRAERRIRRPQKRTPSATLDLKPGELIRIKTLDQVAETLDDKSRNRGMAVCLEMLRLCGREAEVRYRVDRVIDEVTGVMREFADTVTVHHVRHSKTLGEECLCYDELGDCPRGEIMYWREIWLERADGPAISSDRTQTASRPT